MDHGKILGETARLVIEQKNAVALLVQRDVFAAMPGHCAKTELGKQVFQDRGIGRSKFHKLESIDAHWIIELLSHCLYSRIAGRQTRNIPKVDLAFAPGLG